MPNFLGGEMCSHIINDPIHQVMVFSDAEKNLINQFIDTELFQRLRRIKQLGCGDLIFPGAVHTRFNHCLGACYLAKRLYQRIAKDSELKKGTKKKQQKIIMIAALLHDVGHGPFSHAFEKLFDEKFKEKLKNNKKTITECKISHDNDWLKKFLEKFKFNNGIKRNDIKNVLLGNRKDYLSDIISSQLDVDRMDYLLRDSHFCGVTYGKFDLKWLISSVKIVETDQKKKAARNIKERHWSIRTLYFSKKVDDT